MPFVTLTIITAALIVALTPSLQPILVYDRGHIFAHEIWRMFTGHWVHVSTRHLLYDTAAFAIIASIIERNWRRELLALCLLGPWLISAFSLSFAPNMNQYYGLSALALAAWTFLAAKKYEQDGAAKRVAFVMLIGAFAKIAFELWTNQSVFLPTHDTQIRVAATSHLIGALVGLAFAFGPRFIPACVSDDRRAKQGRSESPDYSRQI